MADHLVGQRDGGQGIGHPRQAEDCGNVRVKALRGDIGEGRAGLGQVGADMAGQAKGQPVLAGKDMADPGETIRLMVPDPRKDCRRGRGMGHLPRAGKRRVGGAVAQPGIRQIGRAAVQRQDAGAKRARGAVQQIQPVAMRGRSHRRNLGRWAPAGGNRLGMAGLGHGLRDPAAGGGQHPASLVKDHRLCDGQPVVDPQKQRHASPPLPPATPA